MIFQSVEICCPQCRGDLQTCGPAETILLCSACGSEYPILFGIPDLRIFEDPYLSFEDDRAKAEELAARFEAADFRALVAFYYEDKKDVPPHLVQQYTRGLLAGEARAAGALQAWDKAIAMQPSGGPSAEPAVWLEIGCGTAPLLAAAASVKPERIGPRLVGVDIGLRWLVIAKRRLADLGIDLPLFCACAEALPFPGGVFGRVVSESTLENLRDRTAALTECRRVLRQDGWLCVSTPNRYSLGPDPHTGILAGGYLLDRWSAAIVRRQGGIPPKRRLLSKRALSHALSQAGFTHTQISLPDVPPGQRSQLSQGLRLAVGLYDFMKKLPWAAQLLYLIGPSLLAVAQ